MKKRPTKGQLSKEIASPAPKPKRFIRRRQRAKGIEVVENKLTNRFISSGTPTALRSSQFSLQSAIGIAGILLIFASFRVPFAFFAGVALLWIRHKWRQRTDEASVHYQKAVVSFRKKQYQTCVDSLRKVLQHPKAPDDLRLIEASCLLEMHKDREAFESYKLFFENADLSHYDSDEYWSPKENALVLAFENSDAAFSLLVADSLPESDGTRQNARSWKHYYRGLSFLALNQPEAATEAFRTALNGKQYKSQPFIDSHYQLGFALWKLGQHDQARKQFQYISDSSPGYKDTTAILSAYKTEAPDLSSYEGYLPDRS